MCAGEGAGQQPFLLPHGFSSFCPGCGERAGGAGTALPFLLSAALPDQGQAVGRRLLRPRVDLSPWASSRVNVGAAGTACPSA